MVPTLMQNLRLNALPARATSDYDPKQLEEEKGPWLDVYRAQELTEPSRRFRGTPAEKLETARHLMATACLYSQPAKGWMSCNDLAKVAWNHLDKDDRAALHEKVGTLDLSNLSVKDGGELVMVYIAEGVRPGTMHGAMAPALVGLNPAEWEKRDDPVARVVRDLAGKVLPSQLEKMPADSIASDYPDWHRAQVTWHHNPKRTTEQIREAWTKAMASEGRQEMVATLSALGPDPVVVQHHVLALGSLEFYQDLVTQLGPERAAALVPQARELFASGLGSAEVKARLLADELGFQMTAGGLQVTDGGLRVGATLLKMRKRY